MQEYGILYREEYSEMTVTSRLKVLSALMAVALTAPVPAYAQMPEPACPAEAAPLPAELASWPSRTPIAASADSAGLDAATLAVGEAHDLALRPTPDLHYALRPQNPGGSVSHGGMARFTVAQAGTYRVAIGSAAWIDVIAGDKALVSVAHGRGPACSGIRKMVDFALQPGSYVLQIAGNGAPMLPVLVARLP